MAILGDKARVSSATIPPTKAYPTGRFPIPNKGHAKAALFDLPGAKGLSSQQKQEIRARAIAKLHGKG
jgi:hypothetical protein